MSRSPATLSLGKSYVSMPKVDVLPKGNNIFERITRSGADLSANANLAEYLSEADLSIVQADVAKRVHDLLRALLIADDHNTAETANRVAKMFVREVFAGRYQPRPACTDFPNAKKLDELYTVGPVTVRSCCAHHLCPIEGEAWLGIIPSDRVVGLSKFARMTEWIMARPQIQEEATVQLADAIQEAIRPRALGVIVRARHTCMTWRGVREHETKMTTSVMRGLFRDNSDARSEFLSLLNHR